MNTGRLIGLVALATSGQLTAQLPPLPRAGAAPIQLSGELGSFGELYRRTGAPGRRPGETGRVYLNANAVLFGSLRLGVDVIASTEDGTSLGYGGLPGRQSISQFGLHPQWRWGRAHLGSFTDGYSALTYNAIQLRGASVDLQPGRLRLGAFGGRASSAVFGGATNGAYKRTVAGGRLGFGRQEIGQASTFIELTALRAWDDPNSLPAIDTTLPPNAPTAGGLTLVNPYAVTPEENLVVAAAGGATFLRGKLAWRGELAGAVHTRDVRASELDDTAADVPGVLRGLITPRVGTHADVAFSSDLQLRQLRLPGATTGSQRTLTASLGYRHVGPGYTSLGAVSVGNDVQALDARANIRFSRWSAQLQAGTQNDNLAGQKLSTTVRQRLGGAFSMRLSRVWNASLRASLMTMGNGSADTLQWMDYSAWSFGMGHGFSFGPRRRVESLSIDYSYQKSGDANPLRAGAGFAAQSLNARLSVRVSPVVQFSPTLGLTRSQSDTLVPVTRATYGVSAAWRLWGGRLTTTGSVGRSKYASSNSWTSTLGSRLHLTAQDDLLLNFQVNRFADTVVPDRGFNEQTLTLRWVRRL